MMETDELIKVLVEDLKPVRPLVSPDRRTLLWLVPSLLYVGLVLLIAGLRPDSDYRLHDPRFLLETGAALATGILAAMGALCAACPGWPGWGRLAPTPALAVWLGTLVQGSLQTWIDSGPGWPPLGQDATCIPMIVLMAALPAVLMFLMLRRAAPLSPVATGLLAMLAATSLGAAAVRFHDFHDASLTVLVWQVGSVLLLTLLGGPLGGWALRWPGRPA